MGAQDLLPGIWPWAGLGVGDLRFSTRSTGPAHGWLPVTNIYDPITGPANRVYS